LHGIKAETVVLGHDAISLPFADKTFDHIHSSGVLHHTKDPFAILMELNRVLKPGGTMNVMVYNYDSIWVHLYVAYQRTIVEGLYPDKSLRDQFTHSTDGENCPISNCYRPEEWEALCKSAGFNARFIGAAVSVYEASLMPLRFAAIQDRRLPAESREFLLKLKLDDRGYPIINGSYAGVDACYLLTKST
jgi:SAM-dependent methyltransferase